MRCIKDGAVIPENDEDAVELGGNTGICGPHVDELLSAKVDNGMDTLGRPKMPQKKKKGRPVYSKAIGVFGKRV